MPIALVTMAVSAGLMVAPTMSGRGIDSSLAFQRTDVAIVALALAWIALGASAAGLTIVGVAAAGVAFVAAAGGALMIGGNPYLGELAYGALIAPAVLALAFALLRRAQAVEARARRMREREDARAAGDHAADAEEAAAEADDADGGTDIAMIGASGSGRNTDGRARRRGGAPVAPGRSDDDSAFADDADGDIFYAGSGSKHKVDDDPDVNERLQLLLMRAREAGYSDDAVAYWRQIQEEFPTYSPGVRGEARVLLQLDRVDEARESLDRALVLAPDDETTLRQAARYAFRAEDWAAAADYWARAFAIDDMGANAAGSYLVAMVRAGRPQDARALHRDFMERWPDDDQLFAAGAVIAEALNDDSQAFEFWNAAAKADTSNFSHRKRAIRALLRSDRYREAADMTETYLVDSVGEADAVAMSETVLERAVGEAGDGALDVIARFGGQRPDAWAEHIEKRLAAKDIEGAEAAFRKAADRGIKSPRLLRQGAEAARAGNLSEQATERWAALAESAPDDAGALAAAAAGLGALGADKTAAEIADRALALTPDDANLLRLRAEAAGNLNDWETALAMWRRYGDIAGLDEQVVHGAATALRLLGRTDEGAELVETGLVAYPDSTRLKIDYARLADEAGDLPVAIDRWRAVVAASPENSVAWRKLIGALEKSGDIDGAQAALDVALSVADNEDYLTAAPHVRRLLTSRYGDTSVDAAS